MKNKTDSYLDKETAAVYIGASITRIRRGKGHRNKVIYAEIRSALGELLVSAQLDYCVERMVEATKHF